MLKVLYFIQLIYYRCVLICYIIGYVSFYCSRLENANPLLGQMFGSRGSKDQVQLD